MSTEQPEANEPWLHIGFKHPVRVLLQARSVPLVAVNAQIAETNGSVLTLRVRQAYKAGGSTNAEMTAVGMTGMVIVSLDNIASRLLLKELPK